MSRVLQDFRWTPAVLALLAFNLIPIFGVVQLGWDAGTIVLLYWLENVVIGVLNLPRLFMSRRDDSLTDRISTGGAIYLCVFFSVHYGMFCLGHYLFLADSFNLPPLGDSLLQTGILISLAGLAISHMISLVVNFFGKQEYLKRSANLQMFMPYTRIIILHVVVLIGGIGAQATGNGWPLLLLLVVIKTAVDLAAHVAEHRDKGDLINPGVA